VNLRLVQAPASTVKYTASYVPAQVERYGTGMSLSAPLRLCVRCLCRRVLTAGFAVA
jgi:hypothetical protein